MAKAPNPPPAAEAPAAPAPKRSKKLLVIIGALVLVLVLIIAGVVGLLMLKKGKSEGQDEAENKPATPLVDLSKPPTFVTLDPFVVNLAPAEGDRYLQVVLALRVPDAKVGDSLKGFMPQIRHEINLLLSSKLPSELSTPEGRETLASEMLARINGVLGAPAPAKGQTAPATPGPIEAVLFNSFIIQ